MIIIDTSNVFDSLHRLMRLTKRYQGKGRGHRHSSYGETRLMHILMDNGGLNAKELAERMDIRPPSLTEALDRLEKKGKVERLRDEADSRVFHLFLTEHGRQDMETRLEESLEIRRVVENCLSEEERGIFCELCDKLSLRLAELAENDRKRGN